MAPRQSPPVQHPLTLVRTQLGWTYQDVVDAVARHLGNSAARREKAWRWEHRGVVPDRDSQLALAAALKVSPTVVDERGWPDWLPDGDPIPSDVPWTASGSLQVLEDALEHAVLDRRGFMKLVGPALVGVAEDWLALEPAALTDVLRGGRATEDFVTRMEEGLPRLRLLEAARGGERARRLMDAELGMVSEVLTRSTYSANAGRRLHALAAELSRMAGFAAFDAGMHAAAQRYWVAGLHAAHSSGERAIGANILKSMSLQCYDFNRPQEALALAVSASEGVGWVSPTTEAMLILRQARAHAALGDKVACGRLLAEAERSYSRTARPDDEPAWTSYFDDAEFNAQIGTCMLDLKRYSDADRYLETALTAMPETKVRDSATYVIRRASAQLGLGHVDQAVDLLGSALPLIREAPSQRNVQRAQRIRSRVPLRRFDTRVQDLDEQLNSLSA